jgi:hypothetical protein
MQTAFIYMVQLVVLNSRQIVKGTNANIPLQSEVHRCGIAHQASLAPKRELVSVKVSMRRRIIPHRHP